jgi:hypothetical protein
MRTQYTVKFKHSHEKRYQGASFSSKDSAYNFYKHAVSMGLKAKIVKSPVLDL